VAHKLFPILGAVMIGAVALAVVLAFVAYRRPEMMLFFFSAWKGCL
jgi:uncharacterized membrane protein